MSIGAPTIGGASPAAVFASLAPPTAAPIIVDVSPRAPNKNGLIWDDINVIMRDSLSRAGFPQAATASKSAEEHSRAVQRWRVVAPGVVVTPEDYHRRYGSLDLNRFQQAMSPDVFDAFVRFVGSIPGRKDLDVTEITAAPDE